MSLLVLVTGLAVVLVVARLLSARRCADRKDHSPEEIVVTLSVLPTRTAVVMVGADADPSSAAVAPLVEHAAREALSFATVDVVEVRRRDGQLLERRRRDHAVRA